MNDKEKKIFENEMSLLNDTLSSCNKQIKNLVEKYKDKVDVVEQLENEQPFKSLYEKQRNEIELFYFLTE